MIDFGLNCGKIMCLDILNGKAVRNLLRCHSDRMFNGIVSFRLCQTARLTYETEKPWIEISCYDHKF